MKVVHILETLTDSGYDVLVFSSKIKAMKKMEEYCEQFTNDCNEDLVINKSEESFAVQTEDDEHIFSVEYRKKGVF